MNGVERLRQKLSRYGFILRSIRVKGKILYNVADQISGSSINDYGNDNQMYLSLDELDEWFSEWQQENFSD